MADTLQKDVLARGDAQVAQGERAHSFGGAHGELASDEMGLDERVWVESSNYSIRFVLYASMAHRTCDMSCWKEGRGEEPDETGG